MAIPPQSHLAHSELVATDVDSVPRPVFALRAAMVSTDWEQATHRHRKAQLFYSVRGIVNCEIEGGVWIVPPQCAVWIPGNLAAFDAWLGRNGVLLPARGA